MGHPEHDLLFVATQVGRVSGLKNPSELISRLGSSKFKGAAMKLGDLGVSAEYTETLGPNVQAKSWMFTEPQVYQMLMRGHAPASEPFRKTGKYDAEQSSNPIAK